MEKSKFIFNSLLDLIGNNPVVEIPIHLTKKCYAKLEYLNPSGSIKDRSALYMIRKAVEEGTLKKDGAIIEASSGNQGIAAAMIGSVLGYKVIITVSEKISTEKKRA
jgi:cysteine synthase